MFSGGLDSIVIAALCHYHVPPHEPIDLLNVCFDASKRSPDRISGRNGLLELIAAYPSRFVAWHFTNRSFSMRLLHFFVLHQTLEVNLCGPCVG
jgi:asparagine synthetase B (glutamine-hydrolysing)